MLFDLLVEWFKVSLGCHWPVGHAFLSFLMIYFFLRHMVFSYDGRPCGIPLVSRKVVSCLEHSCLGQLDPVRRFFSSQSVFLWAWWFWLHRRPWQDETSFTVPPAGRTDLLRTWHCLYDIHKRASQACSVPEGDLLVYALPRGPGWLGHRPCPVTAGQSCLLVRLWQDMPKTVVDQKPRFWRTSSSQRMNKGRLVIN